MNPSDILTVHQLLGRLIYFHVLFFESHLPPPCAAEFDSLQHRCCSCELSHSDDGTEAVQFSETAWAGLCDLHMSQPVTGVCPGGQCCLVSQIAWRVTELSRCWIEIEHQTYWDTSPPAYLAGRWAALAGQQVAAVFARQFRMPCAAEQRLAAAPGPDREVLPLSGEFLGLWRDPFASSAPVVSWLNHCTNLHDIRLLLTGRKARP